MKKYGKYFILFFLIGLLAASGCTMKQPSAPSASPGQTAPVDVPGAEATPVPTPEPTPLPYDQLVRESQPFFVFASDASQVKDALVNAALAGPDALAGAFPEEVFSPLPECIRMMDTAGQGNTAAAVGQDIYLLSGKDLLTVRDSETGFELVSSSRIGVDWTGGDGAAGAVSGYEKTPRALFAAPDRLVVLSDWYGYEGSGGDLRYTEYSIADIFDLHDPAAPFLAASFGQDGVLLTAGVWGSSFYLVTDHSVFDAESAASPDALLPKLYTNGGQASLSPDRICLPNGGDHSGIALIGAYDLNSFSRIDCQGIVGLSSGCYAADGYVYFTAPRWAEGESRTLDTGKEYALAACTDIYRYSVRNELRLDRAGTVNGVLRGADALNVSDGALRALVTLRQRRFLRSADDPQPVYAPWESGTVLYTLDDELRTVGETPACPEGETAVWAAFLSHGAAVTTEAGNSYLADSSDPALIGPVAQSVQARAIFPWGESGYMVFYLAESGRMTLSVRDARLQELASRTFGADHSNTLENIGSYYVDHDANLLGFAADDSYCFYGFEEETGLVHRLDIYLSDWSWNARTLVLGDRLFVVDTREVFVYDLPELKNGAAYTF